ncbi:MAG: hypothetical protein RLZZ511_3155 [Cyanobacteriota bacterium]
MVNAASEDLDPMVETEAPIEINFHNRDLRGRDFSNGSWQNIDFSKADLRGCKLKNADLSGANFKGATFGIDDAQVFELLIQGFFNALVGLIYAMLWILMWFNGGQSDEFSDDSAETDNPKSDSTTITNVDLIGFILWVGFVGIGLGIYIFRSRHLTSLLTNCVYGWIGFWTIISGVSVIAMIVAAIDLAKTDFDSAILDGTKMDRRSFKKAKSEGTTTDQITWL